MYTNKTGSYLARAGGFDNLDISMFSLGDETFSLSMSNETVPDMNRMPERCARHQPSRQHPCRRSDSSSTDLQTLPSSFLTLRLRTLWMNCMFSLCSCAYLTRLFCITVLNVVVFQNAQQLPIDC